MNLTLNLMHLMSTSQQAEGLRDCQDLSDMLFSVLFCPPPVNVIALLCLTCTQSSLLLSLHTSTCLSFLPVPCDLDAFADIRLVHSKNLV